MKVYLILDMVVLFIPLLFSFEPRIKYYQKFRFLFPAIISVAVMFLFWDVLAVFRGDWWFNSKYLMGIELAGIPLEEGLFFFVVPFSCIYIFEVISVFQKDRVLDIPLRFFYALAAILAVDAVIFRTQNYSSTVLALSALFFLCAPFVSPGMLRSRNYWTAMWITFIPFLLMNSVLTSVPIVRYNPQAIWGIRVGTIPVEDFVYSYTFLSLNFLVYVFLQEQAHQKIRLRKLAQELSSRRRML